MSHYSPPPLAPAVASQAYTSPNNSSNSSSQYYGLEPTSTRTSHSYHEPGAARVAIAPAPQVAPNSYLAYASAASSGLSSSSLSSQSYPHAVPPAGVSVYPLNVHYQAYPNASGPMNNNNHSSALSPSSSSLSTQVPVTLKQECYNDQRSYRSNSRPKSDQVMFTVVKQEMLDTTNLEKTPTTTGGRGGRLGSTNTNAATNGRRTTRANNKSTTNANSKYSTKGIRKSATAANSNNSREARNKAEKIRRDKLNYHIDELAEIVSPPLDQLGECCWLGSHLLCRF